MVIQYYPTRNDLENLEESSGVRGNYMSGSNLGLRRLSCRIINTTGRSAIVGHLEKDYGRKSLVVRVSQVWKEP